LRPRLQVMTAFAPSLPGPARSLEANYVLPRRFAVGLPVASGPVT
jgi:hypothetical protein